jgi:hypothetical protein
MQQKTETQLEASNLVPEILHEASMPSPPTTSGTVAQASITSLASPLDMPGYKDDAVKDYIPYLQDQWSSEKYKYQFEKAGNVVLDGYIDLDQSSQRTAA